MLPKPLKKEPGFITLMTVLLIAVLAVSVLLGMLFMSIADAGTASARTAKVYAGIFADACAEMGLHAMAMDDNYTGSSALTFAQGSCSYTVSGSMPKIMQVTGTSDGVVQRRTIEKNLSGVTWTEST